VRRYRVIAIVGSVLLALALVEVGLRLVGVGGDASDPGTVPHPRWHHWHRHNYSFTFPVVFEGYEVPVCFNRLGMRDSREFWPQKPPGTFRVALLGDSFAEALQVSEEEGVARQLEERLRPLLAKNVEVLNFGCSGFCTTLELVLVREWVREFDPDLIVCLHHFSDVSEDWAYRPDAVRSRSGELRAVPARVTAGELAVRTVARQSRLIQLLQREPAQHRSASRTDSSLQQTFDAVVHDPYTDDDEKAWAYSLGALGELGAELRRDAIPFLVVLIPIGTQVEPVDPAYAEALGYRYLANGQRLEYRGYQQKVTGYCREQGIACLDLLDGFRAANPTGKTWFYLPRDFHWTAAGHELAARSIAEQVTASGLVNAGEFRSR
jgi:hypothetical protein